RVAVAEDDEGLPLFDPADDRADVPADLAHPERLDHPTSGHADSFSFSSLRLGGTGATTAATSPYQVRTIDRGRATASVRRRFRRNVVTETRRPVSSPASGRMIAIGWPCRATTIVSPRETRTSDSFTPRRRVRMPMTLCMPRMLDLLWSVVNTDCVRLFV